MNDAVAVFTEMVAIPKWGIVGLGILFLFLIIAACCGSNPSSNWDEGIENNDGSDDDRTLFD